MDEFKNIDIRIGKIIEAKDHERARGPMYVLRVDFGKEIGERTMVAGIKNTYSKEELLGKKIACVVNLEPKAIAGIESNAMLLAAESGGQLAILVPDKDIGEGSGVH